MTLDPQRGDSGPPTPGAAVEVTYPLADVMEVSDAVLDFFAANNIEYGLGVFSLALALCCALAPKELTPEEQQLAIKNILEFAGTCFAEGRAN